MPVRTKIELPLPSAVEIEIAGRVFTVERAQLTLTISDKDKYLSKEQTDFLRGAAKGEASKGGLRIELYRKGGDIMLAWLDAKMKLLGS